MSTARVLFKQGTKIYRFLRFETSSDGSLIAFLDRDPRSKRGAMSWNCGSVWVSEDDPGILPSAKFSIHTTGEVHYYAANKRKGTIYIEPLHALTKMALIGFVSIPRVARLDLFDENKDRHDVAATLEMPENVVERITFALEVGPAPQQPTSYGVALGYELYTAIVRVIETGTWPSELSDHFIHGMPPIGRFDKRQTDKVNAELEFYQSIHSRSVLVFREDRGGAYVALGIVPMMKSPELIVRFDREDLRIELISYEGTAPTHKVRFWICDKGGRNKKDDLRKHITDVELSAEL